MHGGEKRQLCGKRFSHLDDAGAVILWLSLSLAEKGISMPNSYGIPACLPSGEDDPGAESHQLPQMQ